MKGQRRKSRNEREMIRRCFIMFLSSDSPIVEEKKKSKAVTDNDLFIKVFDELFERGKRAMVFIDVGR